MNINKNTVKNGVIALLAGITLVSVYYYLTSLQEKIKLSNSLTQAQIQIGSLEKEKQNLLQGLEKEKKTGQELSAKNDSLKALLRENDKRMNKAFSDLSSAQKQIEQLQSQASLLKAENIAVNQEKDSLAKENESLRIKINSVAELKRALGELRKQAEKVGSDIKERVQKGKLIEGNRGFLLKDGKITTPEKIKIEVTPAPVK